jgi:hypothetical protein
LFSVTTLPSLFVARNVLPSDETLSDFMAPELMSLTKALNDASSDRGVEVRANAITA